MYVPGFKCMSLIQPRVRIQYLSITPSNVLLINHSVFSQSWSPRVSTCQLFFPTDKESATSLTNRGHGTVTAWDPIHYTFPVFMLYWVLQANKYMGQGSRSANVVNCDLEERHVTRALKMNEYSRSVIERGCSGTLQFHPNDEPPRPLLCCHTYAICQNPSEGFWSFFRFGLASGHIEPCPI